MAVPGVVMRAVAIGSLLALLMASCAPWVEVLDVKGVTSDERQAAMRVQILPIGALRPSNIKYLSAIDATSCKHLLTDPPSSISNATEQLKIKAARIGANAVIDFSCSRSGTDALGANCWNSVSCAGQAAIIQ